MALRGTENPIVFPQVEYWINWLTNGFASGKWDSTLKGRGYNYLGITPFHNDPDFRRINWRASQIANEILVNQFAEERVAHLHLLANLGPSMAFGSTERKSARLATLAAMISFSAFHNKDRFRFVGYTDELEFGFPQPRDKSYPYQLAEAIMEFNWEGTKRGGLIKAAAALPRQRSLIILISDFMGNPGGLTRALTILAPRHEILPIVLWDEREIVLPGKGFGLYPLTDLETGELNYVFLTNKAREQYATNYLKRRQALTDLFANFGITPHFMINQMAEEDADELMRIFLSLRERV